MQRTPQQVWEATCEDPRWVDDQASILAEIMQEAFASGFREASERMANAIDGHAAKLGSQIAVRVPESVPRGVAALAGVARELAVDQVAVAAAWKRIGMPRPHITEKRNA